MNKDTSFVIELSKDAIPCLKLKEDISIDVWLDPYTLAAKNKLRIFIKNANPKTGTTGRAGSK